MSYKPDKGFGTLFAPKERKEGAPNFRGALRLPSGEIVGVVCWVKDGAKGKFLSLKVDEREGEYQAKSLGLPLFGVDEDRPQERRREAPRQQQRAAPPADDPFDDEIPF